MAAIYKVLSALLSYPTAELQSAVPELLCVLDRDASLPHGLHELATELGEGDLLDFQARYVDLFDRSRSLSLHLFEHVHGESRDRGPAMVELRERYRTAGFDLAAHELPDYLPVFLEFLSLRPENEARDLLADAVDVLRAIGERLRRRGSAYAAVFETLEALAQRTPDPMLLAEITRAEADDPDDLAALDRAWEEAEVRFGAGDAQDGCPRAASTLARMKKPATEHVS